MRYFAVSQKIQDYSFKAKGSGKSGLISVSRPGQEILQCSALVISSQSRHAVRSGISGKREDDQCTGTGKDPFDFLPPLVVQSFYYRNWKKETLQDVYELSVDQHFVRKNCRNGIWWHFRCERDGKLWKDV